MLVELIEVCANLFAIIGTIFVVTFVEHGQDGLATSKVRSMRIHMRFKYFEEFLGFHR